MLFPVNKKGLLNLIMNQNGTAKAHEWEYTLSNWFHERKEKHLQMIIACDFDYKVKLKLVFILLDFYFIFVLPLWGYELHVEWGDNTEFSDMTDIAKYNLLHILISTSKIRKVTIVQALITVLYIEDKRKCMFYQITTNPLMLMHGS